jgi:putative transposase
LRERYAAIEACREEFDVRRMCEVLGVKRSGYYAWRRREPSARAQADTQLRPLIEAAFQRGRGCYGVPRVHAELQAQGYRIGRQRVSRLMRQMSLSAKRPKRWLPSTTQVDPVHPVQANTLARDFTAHAPNQKWVADIPYIPTREGWLYVAGIVDLFSRQVVGLSMGARLLTNLVTRAWQMAHQQRQPCAGLLHHSDRGSQYTCQRYQADLAQHHVQVSMSRTGECWDNAPMESFWATLKRECATRMFESRSQAQAAIFEYVMVFYNRTRRHSRLGYLSPAAFEAQFQRQLSCP